MLICRLFSEGGNYSPKEIKHFKKLLLTIDTFIQTNRKKIRTDIRKNEKKMVSRLQSKMEKVKIE